MPAIASLEDLKSAQKPLRYALCALLYALGSKLNLFIPVRPVAPIEGGRRGQELKFEREVKR